MKLIKILTSALLLSIMVVSCDRSREVQKAAIEQLHQTVREMVENVNRISLTEGKTVYKDDSLCIIHFTLNDSVAPDNVSSNKMEYVYMLSGGKAYEGIQLVKDYMVFIPDYDFNEEKMETIYQNLTYEQALRYKAAVFVNGRGRQVDDKRAEFNIPVPTETGNWEIHYYKENGELNKDSRFMSVLGRGTFSTNGHNIQEMMAILSADNNNFFTVKLIENNVRVVRGVDAYDCTITDSKGNTHQLTLANNYYGKMNVIGNDSVAGSDVLLDVLEYGGEVTFDVKGREKVAPFEYKFKFNADGFAKAKFYI